MLARELVLAHSRAKESIGALQLQLADVTAQLSQERQTNVSDRILNPTDMGLRLTEACSIIAGFGWLGIYISTWS